MLPEMTQQIIAGAEPLVMVTFRRAAKINEDYTTVELGVVVPVGAADDVIAQAVSTGDRACLALRGEVEACIAQVMISANAPTDAQRRNIGQLLVSLGVPPEEHDEALGLLGGRPATRHQAEDRLKRMAALRRNGHNGNGNGKIKPDGWRWEAIKPSAKQAPERPKRKQAKSSPAPAGDQTLAAAMAFELPFGTASHPEWEGKKLGDIAALPEGPDFLRFVKDQFTPTTPDGQKLKDFAIALLDAGQAAKPEPAA